LVPENIVKKVLFSGLLQQKTEHIIMCSVFLLASELTSAFRVTLSTINRSVWRGLEWEFSYSCSAIGTSPVSLIHFSRWEVCSLAFKFFESHRYCPKFASQISGTLIIKNKNDLLTFGRST